MANRKRPVLIPEDHRPLTEDTDFAFLHLLREGHLLALAEDGLITPTQCAAARELLKKQSRKHPRRKAEP